jgi:hypothetical protein
LIGRRTEQDSVGDAEYGSIGADSEPKNREDGNQEPGILRQPSQRLQEISRHSACIISESFSTVAQFLAVQVVESLESKYALVNLVRPMPLGTCK